jgi:DNA-binding SARP family transcriptional activator/predicted ATPase
VPVLSVQLLGPLQLTLEGEPLTGFESDKARALLAFLAAELQQAHRRERLAGLLWPASPERIARRNLRHTLYNLRRLLGDDAGSRAPYLLITHQSIQFDGTAGAWVDVPRFLSLLDANRPATRPPIPRLVEAVELYRGSFLEGFSIADSPEFEEWALLTRERLHRLALDALHRLAHHYLQRGEYERALPYAWRQLELDPWREEAHQQVMRLLAFSGRRGAALAQYEICRRVLAEELHVAPAAYTTELYGQIRDETLEPPVVAPATLPAFLEEAAIDQPAPTFVAREPELVRLDSYLEGALAGKGQVIFVTGGPGRGKTALLGEFARRAMAAHPELLVATGKCNALASAGDPYLPFREILAMLTGDVEARWSAGSISRDHARRLWAALPLAAHALAERGPHITGILVDGPTLAKRAVLAAGSASTPWLERLWERVERQQAPTHGLERTHLFEQVTNVLCRMAGSHPLLLIVDDLQWADAASTALLFHLGRRLPGHRILVAGAYRPEEVPYTRDGAGPAPEQDQPLAKVLAEFKQQFGDVWLDLARSDPDQDRSFVDAYLDTEPNRLGEGFRRALFARTAGHPLFTVELLRAMQEGQDLERDEENRWVQSPALRWETLPARVEGTIEQRVGRLAPELCGILTVACVEGEEFTAQVIARLQGGDERQVLRCLSQDLERKHRLIQAQDEVRVGAQHLSRYRFGHVLFRDYLYKSLSPGERRLLHRRVGTALEGLYGDQVGEIAALLTHHFAGDPEKERHYARLAGERAAAQYANDQAVRHLSRALELTPEGDQQERFVLLLAREQVYDRQSDRDAQRQDLNALEELAAALGDSRRKAEVALRQAWHAWQGSDFPLAIRFATDAADLGHAVEDPEMEAQAHRLWSIALQAQGNYAAAQRHSEQGLTLARAAGTRWLEAEIRRQASWIHMDQGEYAEAEACLGESLQIFQAIGDQHDEMRIQLTLAGLCQQQFNYGRALEHSEEVLRLSRELGSPLFRISVLDYAARAFSECGDYQRAHSRFEQILAGSRQIGVRSWEGHALLDLAYVAHALGESEQALSRIQQALALARETGDRRLTADAMSHLGHHLEALGQYKEAGAAYEQSVALRREMGLVNAVLEPQAGLARVHLAGGDLVQALDLVEGILSHLESRTLEGTEQPLLVYLTSYRVLQAVEDLRAGTILAEGHQLLREIAAKITDEELRRSFLENVATHRELVAEYTRLDPSVRPG